MDFELQLKKVAESYESKGYQVVVRPTPKDLPDFAKDFKVELVGRRVAEGVLVTVKKNREEMAADPELDRYAEVIGEQPGWRYDFFILEAEPPGAGDFRGAQDFSGRDIDAALSEAEHMAGMNFMHGALMTAWAALESAMRMRLRAAGEKNGWQSMPRSLMNELCSLGIISQSELSRLETLVQIRNRIVHGFASPVSDHETVQFLGCLARRLVEESQPAKQPA